MEKVIIITGTTAAGKSTIAHLLIDSNHILVKPKSATTRYKRSESDDTDYIFLTDTEFKENIDSGNFLEWQEVYENNFYGTLKSELSNIWKSNKIPVLILDVKGALTAKEFFGSNALSIFLMPKDISDIKERLDKRGTDKNIEQRLEKIHFELQFSNNFDLSITNDDIVDTMKSVSNSINKFISSEKISNTLVVNFFAAPGSGKSTFTAGLFSKLKFKGINAEIATEYVKDKVWENSLGILNNQVYIFGKQHQKIFRLLNNVEVIVTDSPILQQKCYTTDHLLTKLIESEHNKLNTLNIYLNRKKKYEPKGRTQTEAESDLKGKEILNMLESTIPDEFIIIDAEESNLDKVLDLVLEKI